MHVVKKRGEGPPCFLLHGGPGFDSSYFDPFLQPLEKSLRLFFLEHDRDAPEYTLENIVNGIEKLRRESGHEKILLLGHSAGGLFSLSYAIHFPHNVMGLILESTAADKSFVKESEQAIKAYPDALAGLQEYIASDRTDEDYKKMSLRYIPFSVMPEAQKSALVVFDNIHYNARLFEETKKKILPYFSAREHLPKLTMPTLVITGKHDRVVAPSYSQELAEKMPNAEFVMLENSGHFPHLEEPKKFCEVVEDWMNRYWPS